MPAPPPHPRPTLDPDPEAMRRIGYAMVDRIVEHLATLPEQRVARRASGAELAALVDEPLPSGSTAVEDCMATLFERVLPGLTHVDHPRFHAYIPCPSSFAGAIGAMVAAGTNPFMGSWLGGSTACALELVVLRWISELVGYDPGAAGILTSGGSAANLIGLAAARARCGAACLEHGVLYLSREGHASLAKAARILGFRDASIRVVDCDDACRMSVEALRDAIDADRAAGFLPFFVAANAGTTNSGAVDLLDAIADVCANAGAWFHVDAAYGGFAALTDNGRAALRGMDRADSLTLDPHKWLYCPMGIGCALVRDRTALEAAFAADGAYLKDLPRDEVNFMDRGLELSRPARAFAAWMVIRAVGRDRLAREIREDMRLAALAAELLAEDRRLEVLPVGLSVVTFRHRLRPGEHEDDRAARDSALMEATLAGGEIMLSTTTLQERTTLRLVVMNHRTTEADVRRSVACVRAALRD